MNVKLLADEKSVYKDAYARLLELILEAEERYGEKVYVDTISECGKRWVNVNVYLHGERHIINLIIIKMVNWQNKNVKAWDCKLYVYPAEERRGNT
ncbi:hypothetical protein Hena1_00870 [Erwinia phage Hena1]|uniref:Uncharacterized protein n=1 Tax=Erwinia phage Hena1 TaxID=2678601 RepID=A0A6B9J9K4_9CAUD|nr:hypothetical protein HWC84_gp086 [Erwinia phage Hena1]QGZ16263.1 hypothetical protein Hena1_00870 [Erwinia phage Hena1]